MPEQEKELIAYVPVLHAGYMEMFHEHKDAGMGVLDQEVLDEFPHLRKDIRAFEPAEARGVIEKLGIFPHVRLLGKAALEGLDSPTVVMPDDEVSHQLAEEYFNGKDVIFSPIFLRWDRKNSFVNVDVEPDREVAADDTSEEIIKALYEEADKSSDWWRQVGAALVDEHGGLVSLDHNKHLPSEHTPWIDGDPRNNAKRGVAPEAGTALHAEASLIARLAKEEHSSEGLSLYVTTFPCPACAKLIAESGIDKCYYAEGYAMTDGLNVMKNSNVEIVRLVTGNQQDRSGKEWRRYPEKKD